MTWVQDPDIVDAILTLLFDAICILVKIIMTNLKQKSLVKACCCAGKCVKLCCLVGIKQGLYIVLLYTQKFGFVIFDCVHVKENVGMFNLVDIVRNHRE